MGHPDTAVVTGSVFSAAVVSASTAAIWTQPQRVEALCLPASVCVSRNLQMGFLPFFFLSVSCLAQIPWLCWHEKAGFTASPSIKEERMLLQNSFQTASLWFPHIVGIQNVGVTCCCLTNRHSDVSRSTYCLLNSSLGRIIFIPHGVCCHCTVQVD